MRSDETSLTDLKPHDLELLDHVDLFVKQSQAEGIDREQATGEITLMVNYIIMMYDRTGEYGNRLKELVYTRFGEAWPVAD